jgi:N-methylhydantoinase A
VDIQHDLSTMFVGRVDRMDPGQVEQGFRDLEAEAYERLAAEGVDPSDMLLKRSIDMRYVGQWRSMSIPIDGPVREFAGLVEQFHVDHKREHNYRRDESLVEVYRLNVTAIGVVPKPKLPEHAAAKGPMAAPIGMRHVVFQDHEQAVATPVYARADLRPGDLLPGPVIIEQLDSTTPVPPGASAEVDGWLNIRIDVGKD